MPVFTLHVTTAADDNALALSFGGLIVCLAVFGQVWGVGELIHNMMLATQLLNTQT